jgi:hypothetical protein
MRRVLLAGVLTAAGCQGVVGPFQRYCEPPVRIDDPRLTIPEQKNRAREFLAMPEPAAYEAPRTFAEQPGFYDRQH